MKILNLRIGYETNSSSSHSFVWLPEERSTELKDYPILNWFSREWRLLKTPEEIVGYILTQAYQCLDKTYFGWLISTLVEDDIIRGALIKGDPFIDHQSRWNLHGAQIILVKFFADLVKWIIKQKNLGVVIGNDEETGSEYEVKEGIVTPEEAEFIRYCLSLERVKEFEPFFKERPTFVAKPGNYYTVIIPFYSEVIKMRLTFDNSPPKPLFPESIDLKITDYCDNGCWFCYEGSSENGEHCNFEYFKTLVGYIGGYTLEIALGGGNPLKHPQFLDMIQFAKKNHVIPNFTTKDQDWLRFIKENIDKAELFKNLGIGISVSNLHTIKRILELDDAYELGFNYTFHVINRIHDINEIRKLVKIWRDVFEWWGQPKILVLGFKQPKKDYPEFLLKEPLKVEELKKLDAVVLFDTLAIEQLNVKDYVPPKNWKLFYQGSDGEYTMFIDLVNMQYAKSSYNSERFCIPVEQGRPKWHEVFKHFRNW